LKIEDLNPFLHLVERNDLLLCKGLPVPCHDRVPGFEGFEGLEGVLADIEGMIFRDPQGRAIGLKDYVLVRFGAH